MNSVAHLVGLSELEPIPIDAEVGSRDKRIREDNFPLKDPAILRMRLVSDDLLLDMMIVRRESRRVCSSHDKHFNTSSIFTLYSHCIRNREVCLTRIDTFEVNYACSVKAPLTSAKRGLYSSLCSL